MATWGCSASMSVELDHGSEAFEIESWASILFQTETKMGTANRFKVAHTFQ